MTEDYEVDQARLDQLYMDRIYYATEYFIEREGRPPNNDELWIEMQKFE